MAMRVMPLCSRACVLVSDRVTAVRVCLLLVPVVM